MKKMILFFILLCIAIPYTYGMNPADFLEKIPSSFSSQCYQNYTKISRQDFEKNNTYKFQINKNINENELIITQFGFLLPSKEYLAEEKYYTYTSLIIPHIKGDEQDYFKYINDNNKETFLEFELEDKEGELIINLDQVLKKGEFQFDFQYLSTYYSTSYFISMDGDKYSQVGVQDIHNFSFQYLKIIFSSLEKIPYKEKIQIYKLAFLKNNSIFLVTPYYNDDIEIYGFYNCETSPNYHITSTKNDFSINGSTKTIEVNLDTNPKYNVYTGIDFDNDWIHDTQDNCKYRYNPDQQDSNGDGIGDMCADDDGDGIIGFYDNCPTIKNKNQIDINNNNVGDVCEFDFDKDSIFDSIDNCRNISNPEQEDDDKDGIGNICDNCKYYNPGQTDADGNKIGDICDQKNKFLAENDSDGDLILNVNDNCKNTKNPDQIDSDGDGVGDACDNCKDIKNFKQADTDQNTIGDMCEDSDNDSIIGYLDNCIDIANIDQADDNNNGIGNFCEDFDYDKVVFINDNCPYNYNPEQSDIDKDLIGDACDESDDRYIESNRQFFILLLVSMSVIFLGVIFIMIRKLKR